MTEDGLPIGHEQARPAAPTAGCLPTLTDQPRGGSQVRKSGILCRGRGQEIGMSVPGRTASVEDEAVLRRDWTSIPGTATPPTRTKLGPKNSPVLASSA